VRTLALVQRTDLLVVGAGAMGSATAWWAARAGRSVVLLERQPGHHAHGSSHGRSRIFRLAYGDPYYVGLARAAQLLWRELEEESGAALLETTGGVDHGYPPHVSAVAANLAAADVPYAVLSAAEAGARWPALRYDGDVVHQPDAGRLDADAVVTTLHAEAARHGAEARFSTAVTGAQPTPYGIVVETTGEPVEARVAVVAAGAWLPGLLPEMPAPQGLPPFRVTQEQPVYFAARDAATAWPSFIHWRAEGVPYYGLGAPGDGVKAGEHGSGRVVSPDARLPVDADAVARVEAYAAAWLPGAVPVATRVDSCLYTTTPDESFVLRREGPLVVCSPCSGHGFKFVPEIGRLAATLAS
jgi:sarcosine oxidase